MENGKKRRSQREQYTNLSPIVESPSRHGMNFDRESKEQQRYRVVTEVLNHDDHHGIEEIDRKLDLQTKNKKTLNHL